MTLIELNSEQARSVSTQNHLALFFGHPHGLQAFKHLGDAADLVRVVAAGEDLAGAAEADGQLKRARIEVNGIEVKLFKIGAGRARDVSAAFGKGFKTAVEALSQVRNGAAKMAEHPLDIGKSLRHAAEDEAGGGKSGVHEEADERHEPVIEHGFNADRVGGMNMNDSAKLVGRFPEGPETLVTERGAVDVGEDHCAAKLELLHAAAEFGDAGGGVTERKRGQSDKEAAFIGDDAGKGVIAEVRQADGGRRLFYMRAWRSERDNLRIDAGGAQHLLAVVDVAVAAHGDVVVAGIVQSRIFLCVIGDADGAWSLFNGLDVFRWIVMIMKVDDWHIFLKFRTLSLRRGGIPIATRISRFRISNVFACTAMKTDKINRKAGKIKPSLKRWKPRESITRRHRRDSYPFAGVVGSSNRTRAHLHPARVTLYAAFFRFCFATLAACLPKAVLVDFGRCAMVRFFFAAVAAFLIFRRAAARCFSLAIFSPYAMISTLMPLEVLHCALMRFGLAER